MDELFDLPVEKPKMVLADKGYDSDKVRTALLLKGVLPVIPPKANRNRPIACDFRSYKDRNSLEQVRRIASRCDETAVSFLGFLNIATSCL